MAQGSVGIPTSKAAEAETAELPRLPRHRAPGGEVGAQDASLSGTISTGRPADLEVESSAFGASASASSTPPSHGRSRLQRQDPEDLQAMLLSMSQRSAPWSPEQWLEARQQLLDQGRVTEMPALVRCVRQTSERALKMQSYQTENGESTVDLAQHLMIPESVKWFGRRNVDVPAMPAADKRKVEPPIIVVDQSPLDLVSVISGFEGIQKHPISIVIEVTDAFDDSGMLNINSSRSVPGVMQNLACRTDFARFAEAASASLRSGRATIRDHLTAHHDPYVFVAPDCTMFRGDREEGYPFLENPVHMKSIVCSMASTRPPVLTSTHRSSGEKTEWYATDNDQTALLERLSLIGFSALQDADPGAKTILILSALGCTERGLHPRHAVANSLKHWRSRFARLFHTVFLACGPDRDLAAQFDLAINRPVYSTLVTEDEPEFTPWHWDRRFLALHINCQDLTEIALIAEENGSVQDSDEEFGGGAVVPKLSITKASPRAVQSQSRKGGMVEKSHRRPSVLEDIAEVMKDHENRTYVTSNQAEDDITELYLETERVRRRSLQAQAQQHSAPSSARSSRCSSKGLLDPDAPGAYKFDRSRQNSLATDSPRSRAGADMMGQRRLSMSAMMDSSRGRRVSLGVAGPRRASYQNTGRRSSRSKAGGVSRSASRNSSLGSRSSSPGSPTSRGSISSRASQSLYNKIQDRYKKMTVKEFGKTVPKKVKPLQADSQGEQLRAEIRRRLSSSKADASSADADTAASVMAAAVAAGAGRATVPSSQPGAVANMTSDGAGRPGTKGSDHKAAVTHTGSRGTAHGAPEVWGEREEKVRPTLSAGESLRLKVTRQASTRRAGGSFNPAMALAAGMEVLEQTGNMSPTSPSGGAREGGEESGPASPKTPAARGRGTAVHNVIGAAVGNMAKSQDKTKPPEEWQVRMDLHDLAATFKARSEEIQTGQKGFTKVGVGGRLSELQARKSKVMAPKRKSSPKNRADPVKGFENAMMADLAHSYAGPVPEPQETRVGSPKLINPGGGAGRRQKDAAAATTKDATVLPPVNLPKAGGQLPATAPQTARPSSHASSRQAAMQAEQPMAMDTARGAAREKAEGAMQRKFNRYIANSPRPSTSTPVSRMELGDIGSHNMMLRG